VEVVDAHGKTCVCPAVAALGPRFKSEAIDRAAVRCVLQRSSSRQKPHAPSNGISWNMLMKRARLFALLCWGRWALPLVSSRRRLRYAITVHSLQVACTARSDAPQRQMFGQPV